MKFRKPMNNKNIEQPPAGTHLARCYQIVDLGTQYNKFYDNYRHQVFINFELPDNVVKYTDNEGEHHTRTHTIGKFYTMSLGEKANLRNDLEGWRGQAFTLEELDGFDPKKVLGKAALLNIVHVNNDERTKAKISSISKPMEGMECKPSVNEPLFFALDEFSQESFDALPKGLQDIIMKSQEWGTINKGTQQEPLEEEDDLPF